MSDKKAQFISEVENLLDRRPDLRPGTSQKMLAEVQSLAKTEGLSVQETKGDNGNLRFSVRGNVEGSSMGSVSVDFDKAGDIYAASASKWIPGSFDKAVSYDVTSGKATAQEFVRKEAVPDDSLMDIITHPNISNYRPAFVDHRLYFDQQGKVIEEDTSYENKTNTGEITNKHYNWPQIITDQLRKI